MCQSPSFWNLIITTHMNEKFHCSKYISTPNQIMQISATFVANKMQQNLSQIFASFGQVLQEKCNESC